MNYTYTLNGVTVNPVGKWEIEYRKNKGQIFWRKYLTGELIFKGIDYAYLNSIVDNLVSYPGGCTSIDFIIYCSGAEFWTGVFRYPYSFKFDSDSCEAIGTPEVVDAYTCIMNNYETEYWAAVIRPPGLLYHVTTLRDCGLMTLQHTFNYFDSLYDYLDNLLNHPTETMNCNMTIVSSFIWLDEFPGYAPGHYNSIYGNNNYVTGVPNFMDNIYLSMNSDIRIDLGGTGCNLFDYKLGFKYFESLLRDRFNAYWYIDSDGNFRIEHISYFLSGFLYSNFQAGIDITQIISNCQSFAYRRNKYKYLTEELFDREVWEWQHYLKEEGGVTHGEDFEGVPIYYGPVDGEKSDCVPGDFKEKVISTPELWTDITWAHALVDPDEIECNGLIMVVSRDKPIIGNMIECTIGIISGLNIANADLSTANLMNDFFRWDRIFLNGNMNGNDEIFESAMKIKLQDEIEFPLCCSDEFDPMKDITTEMGDGAVSSAVQTQYSVKIQLLYD